MVAEQSWGVKRSTGSTVSNIVTTVSGAKQARKLLGEPCVKKMTTLCAVHLEVIRNNTECKL